MRDFKQAMVLVGFCSLSPACTASVGYESEDGDEAALGSVQQALTSPAIWRATANAQWNATADCQPESDYVLGSGALASGPYEGLNRVRHEGAAELSVRTLDASSTADAYAVRSDAPASYSSQYHSDGDGSVQCPNGKIAVGGGGLCINPAGRLYRSRPTPDTNGSEPTGWRASCSSGGVTAWAHCVDEDDVYDFTDCRTKRTDGNNFNASAVCDSGDLLVGAGGYCSSSNFLHKMNFPSDLTRANVSCSGTTVHAYAICCGNATLRW